MFLAAGNCSYTIHFEIFHHHHKYLDFSPNVIFFLQVRKKLMCGSEHTDVFVYMGVCECVVCLSREGLNTIVERYRSDFHYIVL